MPDQARETPVAERTAVVSVDAVADDQAGRRPKRSSLTSRRCRSGASRSRPRTACRHAHSRIDRGLRRRRNRSRDRERIGPGAVWDRRPSPTADDERSGRRHRTRPTATAAAPEAALPQRPKAPPAAPHPPPRWPRPPRPRARARRSSAPFRTMTRGRAPARREPRAPAHAGVASTDRTAGARATWTGTQRLDPRQPPPGQPVFGPHFPYATPQSRQPVFGPHFPYATPQARRQPRHARRIPHAYAQPSYGPRLRLAIAGWRMTRAPHYRRSRRLALPLRSLTLSSSLSGMVSIQATAGGLSTNG